MWEKNKEFKGWVALYGVIGAIFLGVALYPHLRNDSPPILDLRGARWKACIPTTGDQCDPVPVDVPGDVNQRKYPRFSGKITYSVPLTTPQSCARSRVPCVLYLAEIGDSAEIFWNSQLLGIHGIPGESGKYAKHYPVSFQIPSHRWMSDVDGKQNLLEIRVHSFKTVQAGIRRGPIGIFSMALAENQSRFQITQSVILPIVSAAMIILFSVAVFLASRLSSLNHDSRPFLLFSGCVACFLISFSEVPREFLPLSLAGHLHLFLRILSDFLFFRMVILIFNGPEKLLKWVTPIYGFFLAAFPCLFFYQIWANSFDQRGFDDAYFVTRLAAPVLVLPHVLGIIFSKNVPSRFFRVALRVLFVSTLILQVRDTLIFQSIISGAYSVKWYPFFLVLIPGSWLISRFLKEWGLKQATAIARDQIAVQVAHDVKVPVAALRSLAVSVREHDPDGGDLLAHAVLRLTSLVDQLIRPEQSVFSASFIEAQGHEFFVEGILREIFKEFSPRADFLNTQFDLVISDEARALRARVSRVEFSRVFANLIQNAIEASSGMGSVRLEVSRSESSWCFTVSDEGSGISEEVLKNFGVEGYTTKITGSGRGLYHAKKFAEKMNGVLRASRRAERGTEVSLEFPLESDFFYIP